jgi:hypothetical protein
MTPAKRIKCRHCGKLFVPDARNRNRQKYCSRPDCRKASKAASQKKWLSKSENQDYFRGPQNVERVRQWRRQNPDYWKTKPKALQDPLTPQPFEMNCNPPEITSGTLQDSLIMQPSVLIGLIANFTGIALQDDMVKTLLNLQQLGQDFINRNSTPNQGGTHDCQNPHFAATDPSNPQKFQLDRPSSGP